MNDRSKRRTGSSETLPEDMRTRMRQAVEDIERDLGEIDMLFPDERAEMEKGLEEIRQMLATSTDAELEIVPPKHRLN
jgi:hypothetical protein